VVRVWLSCLIALASAAALAEGGKPSEVATISDSEGSGVQSSQLKSLTPEEAGTLICNDTKSRTVQRVYRISVCRTVVKDGVSVCKEEVLERTASVQVEGSVLDLNALEQLSPELARVLARHNGFLDLNGLKTLSAAAANELIGQRGSINLEGLETISHEAADALNRHAGPVSLKGLKRVSASTYETLKLKRNARLPNTLTLDQVADGVIIWKREHPGSFTQYATQLANRCDVNFDVDGALIDKYGLSQDRILSPPPLSVMSIGQAGNWLADELSQQCPAKIIAGWRKDSLRFSEMPKPTP